MSVNSDIRDSIIALAKIAQGQSMEAFSAEVLSVDRNARTCSVLRMSGDVQTQFDDVWLMPCVDDGILYLPKVGSSVIVDNNSNLQPYVVMWSELDEINYVINRTVFKMTDGLTQFNAGDNGGMVKVIELTQQLNDIQNLVNDLITKFNSHTHTGVTTGGGTSGTTATPETNTLTPTQRSDIEDTKVTH